jgi:MoaA/NifB/PqqE/SkfB family radical SAM enzyme
MDIPKLVNWSITSRCNLKCEFCFKLNDCDASFADKKLIFKKISEAGVRQITFTGGEPLLEKNISYFAKLCDENSITTSIHTNATLTNKFFEIYKLFDRVSFSLDSNSVDINKELRGYNGYYESVLNKIHYMKEQKRDFVIKTVVSKMNFDSVLNMIPLVSTLQPTFWSIFEFRPLRTGGKNNDKYLLPEKYFDLIATEIRKRINGKLELNIRSNKDSTEHPIFLISGQGIIYTNDKEQGDFVIGSLMENSIKEIWQRIIRYNGISEQYKLKKLHLEKRK